MQAASITITRYGIFVRCPYHPTWLASVKQQVPSWARKWNPDQKTWTFNDAVRLQVLSLCRAYFDVTVKDETEHKAPPQSPPMGKSDWAGELFGVLPTHLHEPVYKALIRVLHPDIGGDTAATQTLTQAYAKRAAA